MRNVTKIVCEDFILGNRRKIKNTETDGQSLWLHGNRIAWFETHPDHNDRILCLSLAGWPTVTTRERLNGVLRLLQLPCGFYQQNHAQLYSGLFWDGEKNVYIGDGSEMLLDPTDVIQIDLSRSEIDEAMK